jgi:hypothetical protein
MKDKVSIKLIGGLGNNLFQIACAYAYSLKHSKELVLINEKFGITHNALDTYKSNILSNITFVKKYDMSKFKVYNEPFFHFQEIPAIEGDVLLNGYFQSEKYFKEYEKEIKELFSYPKECYELINEKYKKELERNTCSIHVRRGDYLKLPDHHPVQTINYYMKAIRQMSDDSLFLVFSDDITWCRENFPDIEDKFIFIEGNKDYEDLLLMNLCKNSILANSSFSWWGAWLNENYDKKVFTPIYDKWFGKSISHDLKDLFPINWKQI